MFSASAPRSTVSLTMEPRRARNSARALGCPSARVMIVSCQSCTGSYDYCEIIATIVTVVTLSGSWFMTASKGIGESPVVCCRV